MKRVFVAMIPLSLLFFASCSGASKKGAWNDEDKDAARKEMVDIKDEIREAVGDNTDAYINCYLEKLEANYENLDASHNDIPGCSKLGQACMSELN